jgi:hypothetical protein
MIGDFFNKLIEFGLYDFILPLILIFTLTFALLEKIKILGKEKHSINVVVALITSIIFVASFERVIILNTFLIAMTTLLIFSVMIYIVLGAFGKEGPISKLFDKKWEGYIIALIFIINLGLFLAISDIVNFKDLGIIFEIIFNPAIIGLIVFMIIIWFITKTDSTTSSSNNNNQQAKPKEETNNPLKPKLHRNIDIDPNEKDKNKVYFSHK